jgi:hypothetical protein
MPEKSGMDALFCPTAGDHAGITTSATTRKSKSNRGPVRMVSSFDLPQMARMELPKMWQTQPTINNFTPRQCASPIVLMYLLSAVKAGARCRTS